MSEASIHTHLLPATGGASGELTWGMLPHHGPHVRSPPSYRGPWPPQCHGCMLRPLPARRLLPIRPHRGVGCTSRVCEARIRGPGGGGQQGHGRMEAVRARTSLRTVYVCYTRAVCRTCTAGCTRLGPRGLGTSVMCKPPLASVAQAASGGSLLPQVPSPLGLSCVPAVRLTHAQCAPHTLAAQLHARIHRPPHARTRVSIRTRSLPHTRSSMYPSARTRGSGHTGTTPRIAPSHSRTNLKANDC